MADRGLCVLRLWGLPEDFLEEDFKNAIEKVAPVDTLFIRVNPITRYMCTDGYVVVKKEDKAKLTSLKLDYNGHCVVFCLVAKNPTEIRGMKGARDAYYPPIAGWRHDVRPGHPDYQLPEPSHEPFVLVPPDQDKPSAHSLIDEVFELVFGKLKVREMLRIEGTCRRWQWMVGRILGGHKFVNMADKTSVWGEFGTKVLDDELSKTYFQSAIVHKMLILNSQTLEHLIICNLIIKWDNIRRAIKQCCPKLDHFYFVAKTNLSRPYYRADYIPVHRTQTVPSRQFVQLEQTLRKGIREKHLNDVPACPCSEYINVDLSEYTPNVGVSISCNCCMWKYFVDASLPSRSVTSSDI